MTYTVYVCVGCLLCTDQVGTFISEGVGEGLRPEVTLQTDTLTSYSTVP